MNEARDSRVAAGASRAAWAASNEEATYPDGEDKRMEAVVDPGPSPQGRAPSGRVEEIQAGTADSHWEFCI